MVLVFGTTRCITAIILIAILRLFLQNILPPQTLRYALIILYISHILNNLINFRFIKLIIFIIGKY